MTKLDIINHILNYDFDSIITELNRLVEENRITAGAAYYVYNPYECYQYNQCMEIVRKAGNSKNYTRYIKRIDSITFQVMWDLFSQFMDKAESFIREQKALPFEQTQKQQLNRELSA